MKLSNTVEGRLHSMPNPAMFTVNGVVFGASTTDFLHHVSATGIFRWVVCVFVAYHRRVLTCVFGVGAGAATLPLPHTCLLDSRKP